MSGGGIVSGGGNSSRGTGGTHGAETPSNLASITPTAREAARGTSSRSRLPYKSCDTRCAINNNNVIKEEVYQEIPEEPEVITRCHADSKGHHHQARSSVSANSGCGSVSVINNACHGGTGAPCDATTCDRYKGALDSVLKASEAVQGRLCERSMLKIEKPSGKAILHGIEAIGKCGGMKSAQESGYKHEGKSKGHDVGHGFKVENMKYYGELKGYDFKSYGTIDKPVVSAHEKSHLHGPEKTGHEKCHSKTSASAMQNYALAKVAGERPVEKSLYTDHYYHRSPHSKPQSAYQVYQETKYSYNVSGVPGTPAQASAAAAFFARSVTLRYTAL